MTDEDRQWLEQLLESRAAWEAALDEREAWFKKVTAPYRDMRGEE